MDAVIASADLVFIFFIIPCMVPRSTPENIVGIGIRMQGKACSDKKIQQTMGIMYVNITSKGERVQHM